MSSLSLSLSLLQSLSKSKQLMRGVHRAELHAANAAECELLEERWLSDECAQAIMAFMQRKTASKL